jgi:hypothetical protein
MLMANFATLASTLLHPWWCIAAWACFTGAAVALSPRRRAPRKLMPSLEEVTCNDPTLTPISSAISSRLFPLSTKFLICLTASGVNVVSAGQGAGARLFWIAIRSICPPGIIIGTQRRFSFHRFRVIVNRL